MTIRRNNNVQLRFDFTSSGQMIDQSLGLTTLGMRSVPTLDPDRDANAFTAGLLNRSRCLALLGRFAAARPQALAADHRRAPCRDCRLGEA